MTILCARYDSALTDTFISAVSWSYRGILEQLIQYIMNEPAHDKTYKMAYAPSKDSDQPGHPPSLIRVFAVRI